MGVLLKNISKSFGTKTVFNNLSLKIKKGEFHVILGPSGEGKSSLLSIIAGLLKPDKGDIWINGQIVNTFSPQKRDVGFVFQEYALFPHLTVYENVAYGLQASGFKKNIIKEKVDYYLQLMDMKDFKAKYPDMLSGGQKQRIALARALATEPKVLLLDEPLSHLDLSLKEQLCLELKSVQHKTGVTMLYVTHNKTEAMSLADMVSVLHDGTIEQVEGPENIFYHPKTPFVASFVGAGNILKVRLLKLNHDVAEFDVVNNEVEKSMQVLVKRFPVFKRKKELLLCVHPEKIRLSNEPEKLNSFLGHVLKVDSKAGFFEVTLNVSGIIIKASIPKIMFMELKNKVWVIIPPNALHPLCGRSHPLPEYLRDLECHKSRSII